MALFKKKAAAEEKPAPVKKTKAKAASVPAAASSVTVSEKDTFLHGKGRRLALADIVRRPHVTERATDLAEKGTYVFEVHPKATKSEVKEAVRALYKVHPRAVRMIRIPAKMTHSRTSNRLVQKTASLKKALVTLQEGEKIEIV